LPTGIPKGYGLPLTWGLANLNADRLVSAAADAHSAVRGRFK
jgi:hypothetical protein